MVNKWTKPERLKYLAEKLDNVGPWGINQSKEAELLGVSRQTIMQDLKDIVKTLQPESVKLLATQFKTGLKNAYLVSMNALAQAQRSGDINLVYKGADTIARLTSTYQALTGLNLGEEFREETKLQHQDILDAIRKHYDSNPIKEFLKEKHPKILTEFEKNNAHPKNAEKENFGLSKVSTDSDERLVGDDTPAESLKTKDEPENEENEVDLELEEEKEEVVY